MNELIVFAAPLDNDPYYAGVADAIFDFQIAFAREVDGRDDLLILTDRRKYDRYAEALGASRGRLVQL